MIAEGVQARADWLAGANARRTWVHEREAARKRERERERAKQEALGMAGDASGNAASGNAGNGIDANARDQGGAGAAEAVERGTGLVGSQAPNTSERVGEGARETETGTGTGTDTASSRQTGGWQAGGSARKGAAGVRVVVRDDLSMYHPHLYAQGEQICQVCGSVSTCTRFCMCERCARRHKWRVVCGYVFVDTQQVCAGTTM